MKKDKFTLDEEYKELDEALAYWGDQELHDMLKNWYDRLQDDEGYEPLDKCPVSER